MKHVARGRAKSYANGDEERVRAKRVVPFGMLIIAGLAGLLMLLFAAREKRPARHPHPRESAPLEAPALDFPVQWPTPLPVQLALFDSAALNATESVLSAQGRDCLSCAQKNGCLEADASGGVCEQLAGNAAGCGPGVTERDMCLKTLNEVFASKCAESLQETPCVCGTTPIMACLEGTEKPTGPIYKYYACDFNASDVSVIQREFTNSKFGAGHANALVQCVAGNECDCFGKGQP